MNDVSPETPPAPPDPSGGGDGGNNKTELETFIEQFSNFDPGAILNRVEEIAAQVGGLDIAKSVSDALEGPLGELTSAVKNLSKIVKSGGGGASGDGPPAPPAPAPPTDSSAGDGPQPGGAPPESTGILDTLFGVPKVGP